MLPSPPLRLVLASTSPWRAQMLLGAGVLVDCVAPACEESAITAESPQQTALARAIAKAVSLASADTITLGFDQVCHLNDEVYSKPKDHDDHRRQLRSLRGNTHTLSNGVALRGANVCRDWVSDVRVAMRSEISDEEIDAYVDTREGAACCGGYRSEGLGAALIERIDGDANAVVGVPLFELITALRAIGWRPAWQTNTSAPPPKVALK